MTNFVKTNLNYAVKVKLNDDGIDILRKNHEVLYSHIGLLDSHPFSVKLDEEGYYRVQLWTLMQDFGPYISLGRIPPFDTDILIGLDG